MQDFPTHYIDYIIVVHGIGEQRPNETVLPIINRFAEIRHGKNAPSLKQVVTLGMVTSQSGKPQRIANRVSFGGCVPWSEFRYIPNRPPKQNLPPFYGEMARDGSNFRFVDMYWADIMQSDFEDVAQPIKRWAESLTGRLERRQKHEGLSSSESWVLPILYYLEETFGILQMSVYFKIPFLSEKIFTDYLGDIQLYGEYSAIRGMAIKRFHELFEKIEYHHKKNEGLTDNYFNAGKNCYIRPRYTIIAHSLGTVLAFEALIYAHARCDIYSLLEDEIENLPLTGYDLDQKHKDYIYLGEKWTSNVDSLVTLGSPIDKFMIIWWNNYKYLNYDHYLLERKQKINVFNYCDEQDPVGHTIEEIEQKVAYQKIFSTKEDLVYNRYTVPGKAHIAYWDDIDLFKRIIHKAIDHLPFADIQFEDTEDDAFVICKKEVFIKVLFFTYFFLPSLSVFLFTGLFLLAYYSSIFVFKAAFTSFLVVVIYIAFRIIKLMIWWRQILRAKRKHVKVNIEGQEGVTKIFLFSFKTLLSVHSLGFLFQIPWFLRYLYDHNHLWGAQSDFFSLALVASLVGGIIYYRFRSVRRFYVPQYSLKWTMFVLIGFIITAILMAIFNIVPLSFVVATPSIVGATYWVTGTVVWFYAYFCYYVAKHILKNI